MATVNFDGFVKRYGDTTVLKTIDLHVEDGEFLVLVGPSGCGKSTMLRSVAGLETVSDGTIRIGGDVVNDRAPRDRDIAMVFQSYALYPHMTVRENMSFGLKVRKMAVDEIEKRVNNAAELLGITHFFDRFPRDMSGGQRQRVAMGRAIVRDPKVFLFDEPLSNLDAGLRTQMRAELKRLHDRLGTTVIYVTHDQVEAMTLADRIVLLYDGVIQQVGTPAELFDTPANVFTASFIGSPSMNFFHGSLRKLDSETLFSAPGIALEGIAAGGIDDTDIIIGIRPQDLKLADSDSADITGTVEIVEALGRESIVNVRLSDERQIQAQLPSKDARLLSRRDDVGFTVSPGATHLFDSRSEERIHAAK